MVGLKFLTTERKGYKYAKFCWQNLSLQIYEKSVIKNSILGDNN